MNHNLEIPGPLYEELQRSAERQGTTPVGWIAGKLQADRIGDGSDSPDDGLSLADRFADILGGFASTGEGRLSERTGKDMAEDLAEKKRVGTL